MHYLSAEKYTYLSGEINALYHEAAVKLGISDSVQNILYVVWEAEGSCPQNEICRLTGISRQTINTAVHKLEQKGIVRILPGEGRNTIVALTEKGKAYAAEKIQPLFDMENKIWSGWTPEEQQAYLRLTQKYRDALKAYVKTML